MGRSCVAVVIAVVAFVSSALAGDTVEPGLAKFLGPYTGCIEIRDVARGTTVRLNEKACAQRRSPCSTFKIYNALVGLEEGVVKDEHTTFKWDGVKQPIDSWNRDHDLASAMKNSVVWYFQKVAAGIGMERMNAWMAKVPYGNSDTSGGITTFWLGSTLQISPDEQVRLLERLYAGKLPFRPDTVATVKKILVQEEKDGAVFSGKTGSCHASPTGPTHGWFVGRVTSAKGDAYLFAIEIDGEGAWGPEARRIALEVLTARGLWK